ncbi:hypothetical protein [Methanospirillum lacunae]|uniref:Uncharacterized protein n=2 Tax=Methanospirillum lacunae TaxID=668570 RepID=A0A2V2MTE7_9EURY|nr:hypothetical protein DK846_11465 [Methanospirillum lacunae]
MVTMGAIVTRRLREGKTYEDFRKRWFHTTGFASENRMFSLINIEDPREIIVIGLTESSMEDLLEKLRIDVKERLENPLDEVIEPEIGRTFGVMVSEDDFSSEGSIEYSDPSIRGKKTDVSEILGNIQDIRSTFAKAALERDEAKK